MPQNQQRCQALRHATRTRKTFFRRKNREKQAKEPKIKITKERRGNNGETSSCKVSLDN